MEMRDVVSILFLNAWVITMNPRREILEQGAVCVKGGTIAEVGLSPALAEAYPEAEVIDCRGNLIFPGLIEPMAQVGTALLGRQHADHPGKWRAKQRRFWREADEETLALDGALLARKALNWGITTLGIIYPADMWEAGKDSHLRGAQAAGIRPLPFFTCSRGSLGDAREHRFFDGILDELSPGELQAALDGGQAGTNLFMTRERFDKYQDVLPHIAADGSKPAFSGCHGISFPQVRRMAKYGIRAIYGPDTCLPDAHTLQMLHQGVPVALTSYAGHNRYSMDLMQTARRAQLYHITVHDDYHILPYGKTLEMMTIESAQVLGIQHITGSLEPGKSADLCVFDWRQSHLTPNFMPLQCALARGSGRDFSMVMANGQFVKRNGGPRLPAESPLPEGIRRRWGVDG